MMVRDRTQRAMWNGRWMGAENGRWLAPCPIGPTKCRNGVDARPQDTLAVPARQLLDERVRFWIGPSVVEDSAVVRAQVRATGYQECGRHEQEQKTHSHGERGDVLSV